MAANAKKPVISGQHSVFLTGYIYIIRCQKQSELKDLYHQMSKAE